MSANKFVTGQWLRNVEWTYFTYCENKSIASRRAGNPYDILVNPTQLLSPRTCLVVYFTYYEQIRTSSCRWRRKQRLRIIVRSPCASFPSLLCDSVSPPRSSTTTGTSPRRWVAIHPTRSVSSDLSQHLASLFPFLYPPRPTARNPHSTVPLFVEHNTWYPWLRVLSSHLLYTATPRSSPVRAGRVSRTIINSDTRLANAEPRGALRFAPIWRQVSARTTKKKSPSHDDARRVTDRPRSGGAGGGVRFDAFEPTGAARMRCRW